MYRHFFKRLFDIIIALIALPFFIILFIIFAPIIFLTDRGPVFYLAARRGKNGKTFKMVKFRSMKVNAPDIRNEDGSAYSSAKDPRMTKIGKIMRETSVDEFPQILNVLVGDMSIIGPRAFVPMEGMTYDQLPEERKKRLSVRPGITGYTQAYFRNSITMEEKVKYDCYYADHVSFWFDLKILFKTVATVLRRKDIYANTEKKTESDPRKTEIPGATEPETKPSDEN